MQDDWGRALVGNPTVVAVPSGLLKQYDLSPHGVVLIEEKPSEVVLSWSASITARGFLAFCYSLVGNTGYAAGVGSTAFVSAGEKSISGDVHTVLRQGMDLPDDEISSCDFIRLDLSFISLAFHDFGSDRGRIVSWVGTTLKGSSLTSLLKATATPIIGGHALSIAMGSQLARPPFDYGSLDVAFDPKLSHAFGPPAARGVRDWAAVIRNDRGMIS